MRKAAQIVLFGVVLVAATLTDVPLPDNSAIDAQGRGGSFVAHPRLFLTPAKKAELVARLRANTSDAQLLKASADSLIANKPWLTLNSTLEVAAGRSDTTFSVADGSIFPTGPFQIRINLELISIASRSGNVLTVAANGRGVTTNVGWATAAAAHARGATVWQHMDGLSHVEAPPMLALLVQLGMPQYELPARAAMSVLMMYAATVPGSTSLDQIRFYWANVALTFDWLYDRLTANERTVYAEAMRWTTDYHLHAPNVPKEWFTLTVGRQSAVEGAVFANIANGQLRSELMLAAASYGDNPQAVAQWNEAKAKVDKYLVPALTTGGAAEGVSLEGSEYAATSWTQSLDIFDVIASATGDERYLSSVVDIVAPFAAKNMFYATMPGSTNSVQTTVGSIAAGSRALNVRNSEGWTPGQSVRFALDPSPGLPNAHESYVTSVDGQTLMLADPSPLAATNQTVTHQINMIPWGDAVENDAHQYLDTAANEQFYEMMYHLLDRVRKSNPTLASQIKFWIDQHARENTTGHTRRMRFMWHDPTVVPVDYRLTLPTIYGSVRPTSTGLVYARSDWSATPTMVYFLVNGERFDHTHSDQNSYGIWRKGVWLSREIPGYAVTPYPGPWHQGGSNGIDLGKYRGPRYHNTVLMNLHGGANGNSGILEVGPPNVERSEIAQGYFYARGNASNIYKAKPSDPWTLTGFPNDSAETFVRDFLYLKPDLVAFADRVEYRNSSSSPTIWIAQFPQQPVITRQRMSMSYGGQKIVQDVVVPTSATLKVIDQLTEYPGTGPGSLSFKIPHSHWRVETTSGASTDRESSLQIIQTMDAAAAPASVSSLTTTNANISQVGDYVIGAVKDATPTFPITYRYAGTPTHVLMGFMPSTPYHVVNAGGTVTISAATGSGDLNSSGAGLLIFPAMPGVSAAGSFGPPPAPTSLRIRR